MRLKKIKKKKLKTLKKNKKMHFNDCQKDLSKMQKP